MANKAKDAPVKTQVVKEGNNEESEVKPQVENANGDEASDDDAAKRQRQRQSEWGTQCDRWLIRCQQKNKSVELHLNSDGNYSPNSGVIAVPRRIDQYFVQFEIAGREVWVNKRDISGIGAVEGGD